MNRNKNRHQGITASRHRGLLWLSHNHSRLLACVFALIAAITLPFTSGCDRDTEIRPPTVFLGQSECDVCRMIISDDRYAAGVVEEDERGRHRNLLFDDIGCVFDYERRQPDAPILAAFVRDYNTQEWINVEDAHFVHSRYLHSPMAFGIAAFATDDAADRAKREYSGKRIEYDEARQRFLRGELTLSAIGDPHDDFKPGPAARELTAHIDGYHQRYRVQMTTPLTVKAGEQIIEFTVRVSHPSGDWLPAGSLTIRLDPEPDGTSRMVRVIEQPAHVEDGHFRAVVQFDSPGQTTITLTLVEGDRDLASTVFEYEVTP